jgi:membrane protein required for colicin V production
MQLIWVDLAILSLIALSVLTGLFRGFVKELISLSVWVLAIWLAYHYGDKLHPFLMSYIHDKHLRTAVAFLILFFATLILGGIVNSLLNFIMRRTGLSGTDRALGMGFGLLRGVFIIALLMVAVRMTSLPYQQYAKQSKLYAQFE